MHGIFIGEKVWYNRIRDNKVQVDKLETEWFEGIWLGHNRNSNEILIGTAEGVIKAYVVRCKPEEELWDGYMIKNMEWAPQRPNPNKPRDHVPVRINFDEPVNRVPEEGTNDTTEINMRRFRITIPMLNKHGCTEGCEGCRFKQAGLDATRAHSEACRNRLLFSSK